MAKFMDTTYSKLSDLLSQSKSIAVITAKDPNLDQMGAALALYLSLSGDANRNVSIATPEEPLVEVSELVGIDKVKTSLGGTIGDLVVSFPYKEGEIDKVSYTLEGDSLNIVVKAGELGLSFNEKDVKFTRPSSAPDLLFIVGAPRVSDLGKLFDPLQLKDTKVVNIDNSPENQGYGDIVMVSSRLSSVSEQIANLIFNLGFKMDVDTAQNLMWGILYATENFQNPRTSTLAFEMAAELMKMGAVRQPHQSLRTAFTRSSQAPQGELQEQFNKVQNIQSSPVKQASEANKPSSTEAPDDWLAPKIYKGSTSFES